MAKRNLPSLRQPPAWWDARQKLRECVTILRTKLRKGEECDSIDLADDALWSQDPEVRDARGYLEAWADVGDLTVSQMIDEIEGD